MSAPIRASGDEDPGAVPLDINRIRRRPSSASSTGTVASVATTTNSTTAATYYPSSSDATDSSTTSTVDYFYGGSERSSGPPSSGEDIGHETASTVRDDDRPVSDIEIIDVSSDEDADLDDADGEVNEKDGMVNEVVDNPPQLAQLPPNCIVNELGHCYFPNDEDDEAEDDEVEDVEKVRLEEEYSESNFDQAPSIIRNDQDDDNSQIQEEQEDVQNNLNGTIELIDIESNTSSEPELIQADVQCQTVPVSISPMLNRVPICRRVSFPQVRGSLLPSSSSIIQSGSQKRLTTTIEAVVASTSANVSQSSRPFACKRFGIPEGPRFVNRCNRKNRSVSHTQESSIPPATPPRPHSTPVITTSSYVAIRKSPTKDGNGQVGGGGEAPRSKRKMLTPRKVVPVEDLLSVLEQEQQLQQQQKPQNSVRPSLQVAQEPEIVVLESQNAESLHNQEPTLQTPELAPQNAVPALQNPPRPAAALLPSRLLLRKKKRPQDFIRRSKKRIRGSQPHMWNRLLTPHQKRQFEYKLKSRQGPKMSLDELIDWFKQNVIRKDKEPKKVKNNQQNSSENPSQSCRPSTSSSGTVASSMNQNSVVEPILMEVDLNSAADSIAIPTKSTIENVPELMDTDEKKEQPKEFSPSFSGASSLVNYSEDDSLDHVTNLEPSSSSNTSTIMSLQTTTTTDSYQESSLSSVGVVKKRGPGRPPGSKSNKPKMVDSSVTESSSVGNKYGSTTTNVKTRRSAAATLKDPEESFAKESQPSTSRKDSGSLKVFKLLSTTAKDASLPKESEQESSGSLKALKAVAPFDVHTSNDSGQSSTSKHLKASKDVEPLKNPKKSASSSRMPPISAIRSSLKQKLSPPSSASSNSENSIALTPKITTESTNYSDNNAQPIASPEPVIQEPKDFSATTNMDVDPYVGFASSSSSNVMSISINNVNILGSSSSVSGSVSTIPSTTAIHTPTESHQESSSVVVMKRRGRPPGKKNNTTKVIDSSVKLATSTSDVGKYGSTTRTRRSTAGTVKESESSSSNESTEVGSKDPEPSTSGLLTSKDSGLLTSKDSGLLTSKGPEASFPNESAISENPRSSTTLKKLESSSKNTAKDLLKDHKEPKSSSTQRISTRRSSLNRNLLPTTSFAAATSTEKRGRGRPPKNRRNIPISFAVDDQTAAAVGDIPEKKNIPKEESVMMKPKESKNHTSVEENSAQSLPSAKVDRDHQPSSSGLTPAGDLAPTSTPTPRRPGRPKGSTTKAVNEAKRAQITPRAKRIVNFGKQKRSPA